MSRVFGKVCQSGYVVRDIERALARWTEVLGVGSFYCVERGQEVQIGEDKGRFVYFDTEAYPGTVIEMSDISGTKGEFFTHIRKQSDHWDGSCPIRFIK